MSYTDDQRNLVFTLAAQRAKGNFPAFLRLLHPQGHSPYILSRVHLYLADLVQGVWEGTRGPRQAISLPPQHGKSWLLSVRAVAWVAGAMPGTHIALAGFSHDLMCEFLGSAKAYMASPLYQLVFPGVCAEEGADRQDFARLSNGSVLRVGTIGKPLTGRRVDWLILDDVHAGREGAESKRERERVRSWYFADCDSRLSPEAKVFLIGTRWRPDDLIGTLTAPDYVEQLRVSGFEEQIFQVTNLPAIADHSPEAGGVDPIGRAPGEPLFPEVRNLAFLEAKRAVTPAYEWDSQYQGKPRAPGSRQVDVSVIKRVRLEEVPTDIPWVRGWDLALTEKQTSDFSAGALCAFDKRSGQFYVIDVYHQKKMWTRLKPDFLDLTRQDKARHNCQRVGLEAVAGFKIGLAELRQELLGEVTIEERNPPKGGKLARALDWLNLIPAGKLSIVTGGWNKAFVDELEGFPDGAHDDQCFAAGTMILTDRGEVPIEKISEGDRVFTGQRYDEVLWAGSTGQAWVEGYMLPSGREVGATAGHPVIVGNQSVRIGTLADRRGNTPGFTVWLPGSVRTVSGRVVRLLGMRIKCPVYNLQVKTRHRYFANGLLVHNCDAVSVANECLRRGAKLLYA